MRVATPLAGVVAFSGPTVIGFMIELDHGMREFVGWVRFAFIFMPMIVIMYLTIRISRSSLLALFPTCEINAMIKEFDTKRTNELSDKEREAVLQYLTQLKGWFPTDSMTSVAWRDLDDIDEFLKIAHSVEAEKNFMTRMEQRELK